MRHIVVYLTPRMWKKKKNKAQLDVIGKDDNYLLTARKTDY